MEEEDSVRYHTKYGIVGSKHIIREVCIAWRVHNPPKSLVLLLNRARFLVIFKCIQVFKVQVYE